MRSEVRRGCVQTRSRVLNQKRARPFDGGGRSHRHMTARTPAFSVGLSRSERRQRVPSGSVCVGPFRALGAAFGASRSVCSRDSRPSRVSPPPPSKVSQRVRVSQRRLASRLRGGGRRLLRLGSQSREVAADRPHRVLAGVDGDGGCSGWVRLLTVVLCGERVYGGSQSVASGRSFSHVREALASRSLARLCVGCRFCLS